MNNKLLVSIIIPCFNDADYIEQSVNSALNQSYGNIEVIVVDDGSNIETKEVLKKIAPKITKLIIQENNGQSRARNIGIENAKGEYIVVLDSDDFFETTFCEKAVKTILSNTQIKIVSCYANILDDKNSKNIFKPRGGDLKEMLIKNVALGSLMFRKKDWKDVDGYDESMRSGFEDWEYYIRLLSSGGEAYIIEEVLFNYRKRIDSTTKRANKKKYELLKFIYFKHQDLYNERFEIFVTHLLDKIEREENEKIKRDTRLEYKVGAALLKPLRFIKKIFR